MEMSQLRQKWLYDTDVAICNREHIDKHHSVWHLAAGDRYIIALCTAAQSPRAVVERAVTAPLPNPGITMP